MKPTRELVPIEDGIVEKEKIEELENFDHSSLRYTIIPYSTNSDIEKVLRKKYNFKTIYDLVNELAEEHFKQGMEKWFEKEMERTANGEDTLFSV